MSMVGGGQAGAAGNKHPPLTSQASPVRDFGLALQNWATVIGILMVRHFDSRSRAGRLSVLIMLAEPFLTILGIYMIRGVFKGIIVQYGTSLFLFLVSGILPFFMFIRTSTYARRGQGGTARRLPRITSLDTILASVAANALIWTVVIGATFLGMWLYGIEDARPKAVDQCAIALFLLFVAGAGFGLINSAISRFIPVWQILMGFATRGLMFLSGVIHIADFYSLWVREWVVWNPILHGVEWFRLGVYGRYPTLTLDQAYLVKCAFIFLFIGIVADRATLRYGSK